MTPTLPPLPHRHTARPNHRGIVLAGYSQKWYAWECMVMLRKFVLVCVAVLLANAQDGLQIYAGMGVVCARPLQLLQWGLLQGNLASAAHTSPLVCGNRSGYHVPGRTTHGAAVRGPQPGSPGDGCAAERCHFAVCVPHSHASPTLPLATCLMVGVCRVLTLHFGADAGWLFTMDIGDTTAGIVSVLVIIMNVGLAATCVWILLREMRTAARRALNWRFKPRKGDTDTAEQFALGPEQPRGVNDKGQVRAGCTLAGTPKRSRTHVFPVARQYGAYGAGAGAGAGVGTGPGVGVSAPAPPFSVVELRKPGTLSQHPHSSSMTMGKASPTYVDVVRSVVAPDRT